MGEGALTPGWAGLGWPSEDGLVLFLDVVADPTLEPGSLSNPWGCSWIYSSFLHPNNFACLCGSQEKNVHLLLHVQLILSWEKENWSNS